LLSNCNGWSNSVVRNMVVPRQKNLKPRNCGRRRRLNRPHLTPAATRGSPLPHFSLPCWGRESPALPAGGRGLRPYQLSPAESSVLPHQSKSGNAGDGSQCLDTKESPAEAGPSVRVFAEEGVLGLPQLGNSERGDRFLRREHSPPECCRRAADRAPPTRHFSEENRSSASSPLFSAIFGVRNRQ
jgi:hypothetical protein